jgi:magnesium transporter
MFAAGRVSACGRLGAAVITCRIYRDGELQDEAPFDPALLATSRDGSGRIWVDVVDPSDEELHTLQRELGLHELAVEDSRSWGQRAKVDFYPEHLFLVAHGLDLASDAELVDREVHVFAAGRSFIVTIRREPRFEFDRAKARVSTAAHLSEEGIGHLLYLLLDEIVDGYLDTIDRFEDLADDIEEAVAQAEDRDDAETSRSISRRIFHLRQRVVRFRRVAGPMREVVDLLLETPSIATPPLVPYYRDILDHVIRTMELADNVRDLLTSARELQLAQVTNRLNVVTKQLSAWAAIILIPTLIAGIYGMNFDDIPELGWAYGYPFALAIMGLSALLLYWVFRRRHWL